MDGLYQVRLEPEGGGKSTNAGVMVLRDGQILGGDAFFFYVGSYAATGEGWRGEFKTGQHTRTEAFQPAFGALDAPVRLACAGDAKAYEGTAQVGGISAAAYKIRLLRIADA